jgi:uncharacterized protein YjbI with pentapeptide repeats
MIGANLSGTNFKNTDLTDVDLTDANYDTALFHNVRLCRTKMSKPIKHSLDCDSNRS